MEAGNKQLKRKPMKIEDMTKEQIRHAIVKKKECNAKAQHIVECLLEKGISESLLLQCLPDINQAHFDDIIEERSILHLCGYPICEHSISEKDIPKQKYRISLKTNKVYDITARKNFCSNSCYNAAMYLKKQMLTSPLWFREYEIVPKFQLLPLNTTGSMGQEIDVALINRVETKSGSNVFTSINDFTQASLNEMHDDVQNRDSDRFTANTKTENDDKGKEMVLNENNLLKEREATGCIVEGSNNKEISQNEEHHVTSSKILKDKSLDVEVNKPIVQPQNLATTEKKNPVTNPMNIVGEIVEKAEKKIDPILIDKVEICKEMKPKKAVQKKQPVITALTIQVEKCLAEWFTLDTMLFLFGDKQVRDMVMDKGECIKEYLNNYAKSIFYNAHSYDQYQQLCRKLNMLEIEDRRHDAKTLQKQTKPLPDYSILQEESKKMQLKVKAFLVGQTEIEEPDPVVDNKASSEIEPIDSSITQLPLVDKNAQNALRRRIVCQHLNKVLPDLLRSLGLLTLTVSSDVRLLVNTFKLRADNIMFKPLQWTLIAIVFIKLLSLRDKRLQYLLEQPMGFQHMQLLLLSFKQDGGYLDRLISWLTDIDRLLDTNDTQLTME